MQRFLLLVTYFVGMAALVLAGILGYEGYRESRRLNAEIASLKAEIQQLAGTAQALEPIAESNLNTGDGEIAALKNRIAILEEAWRNGVPSTGALPPLQPEGAGDTATAPSGDCIPMGTRFLATIGQTFAICGTEATVEVSSIGASDIVLGATGTVPVGGQREIEGTNCVVAGLTADQANGFAELRVTCS